MKNALKMRLPLIAVALLAAGTGCAPTLKIQVLQPAPANFGAANRLTVYQTEGRRSAREFLLSELQNQARTQGYFQTQDRSEEGNTIKLAGRSVNVQLAKQPAQVKEEVGVRMDVLDWRADREVRKVQAYDSQGRPYMREETVYVGKALLGVTAFNHQGQALLAEREYQSTGEAASEEAAIRNAATMAVAHFLNDITPKWVSKSLRMDDSDEQQKPLIKIAEQGNLPRATEEMRGYLAKNPQNAGAMYNLAVLLDASGQYQEALDLYTKAISSAPNPKDFYANMRAECAKRLADQQAMTQ